MGELFWNKIFGAVLGTALVLFSLVTVSDILFDPMAHGSGHGSDHGHGSAHGDDHAEGHATTKVAHNSPFPGYPIELPETGTGTTVVVEEGPVDYGVLLAAANPGAGERVFSANCASCHNIGPDAAHGQGPRMWDVVGQPAAAKAGYGYSSALAGWDQNWSYENLDGFIERPARYVSGTAMNFRGVGNEAVRMDLIAYLRTLSDSPYPLPDPLPAEPAGDVVDASHDGDHGDMPAETSTSAGAPSDSGESTTETMAGEVDALIDEAAELAPEIDMGEPASAEDPTGE